MTQRQVLLGTGAMVVGLGAALLSGSAVAHADNDDSAGQKASSSTAGKSTGASRRASTPSAATRSVRSPQAAQKASPTAAATPTPVTTGVATSRRAGMRSLATSPSAPASDLLASAALSVLANLGAVPRTNIPAATTTPSAPVTASTTLPGAPTNGVTGVLVGHSRLDLPGAFIGKTVAADWYFPTQADGTLTPTASSGCSTGSGPRTRCTRRWPPNWRSRPTASWWRRPCRRCRSRSLAAGSPARVTQDAPPCSDRTAQRC